jgi:hypothetical protein
MADDVSRIPEKTSEHPAGKNENAKINYTATGYGNEHGSLHFGRIDRHGQVTAGVQLQAQDGRQQVSLDNDGPRKGYTTVTTPANFQVRCGTDKQLTQAAQDSLCLNAENGNILINAGQGKIRLQAKDIEIIALDGKGTQGNIRLNASESITQNSKQNLVHATVLFSISSIGIGNISANTCLNMYGSMIRGVTDAVYHKDSKVGGKLQQMLNNMLTAVNILTN